MLMATRLFTSPEGVRELERRLRAESGTGALPETFEVLFSVTSFEQTDLAGEIVEVHAGTDAAVRTTTSIRFDGWSYEPVRGRGSPCRDPPARDTRHCGLTLPLGSGYIRSASSLSRPTSRGRPTSPIFEP